MKKSTYLITIILLLTMLTACVPVGTVTPDVDNTASDSSTETRTITHAMGETEVPTNPQRVVTLDAFFTLTPLVELGVPVVGSMSLGEDDPYPGLTAAEQANITSVGGFEVNLEAVAALNPDLIIGVDFVAPPYEALSQIAPTVVIATSFDWQAQHRTLAQIVGKEAEAEAGIAEYEARVAALRNALPDITATVMTLHNEAVLPMGPGAWAPVKVLDSAGVGRPENEVSDDPAAWFLPLSKELWPELGGDVLFYTAGYPGMDEATAELVAEQLENPIWQQIPAVQNGQAYAANTRCWETFGGLRSAHCVLDDIEQYLLPASAADDACDAGFRLFDHELLETEPVCIPENPERIVALAPSPFEIMLAIGEEIPVGAIGYLESIYQRNFPYTNDKAANVEFVGFPANLEAVVALQPDLIVQSPFGQEDIELVQQIAPTVILPLLPNVRWEENMRFTGDLLNRSDEVETLIAQYNERVATLRDLIGDPSEIEISVVRYFDNSGASGLQMQLVNAFSTDMLADVGFVRPESQAYSAEEATEVYGHAVAVTLSLEELPLIDGQYLFAWSQAANAEGDAANEGAWTALSEDPIWGYIGSGKERADLSSWWSLGWLGFPRRP
ncbi:MAG: ABC transporter substrate-binding protein [Chloroflexota bacterium]